MVSVIIPMYNSRNYIKRCLDSVVGQSYRDLEIIVVDDGSTDGSGTIADDYAHRDRRIQVIHGENQGLVRARKRGIQKATGDYVLFVDSDDFIDERALENLIELTDAYDPDVVCGTAIKRLDNMSSDQGNPREGTDSGEKKFESKEQNLAPNGFYSGSGLEDLKRKLFCIEDYCSMAILPYLVCKLWKRDLISRFVVDCDETITVGEDVAIGFPSILAAKSIYIVDLPFYYYCQHQDSMMGSIGNVDDSGQKDEKEYQNAKTLYEYLLDMIRRVISGEKQDKSMDSQTDMLDSLEEGLSRYYTNQLFTRAYVTLNQKMNSQGLYPFLSEMPKKLIIYGAGELGKAIYRYAKDKTEVVAWIDGNASKLRAAGLDVVTLNEFRNKAISETCQDTDIIIAIFREKAVSAVTKALTESGFKNEKIHIFDLFPRYH